MTAALLRNLVGMSIVNSVCAACSCCTGFFFSACPLLVGFAIVVAASHHPLPLSAHMPHDLVLSGLCTPPWLGPEFSGTIPPRAAMSLAR